MASVVVINQLQLLIVRLNGRLAYLNTVVHRFRLIGCFDRLNGHFSHSNTHFAQIMG